MRRSNRALNYLAIRDEARTFSQVAGMRSVEWSLIDGTVPVRIAVGLVSAGAFAFVLECVPEETARRVTAAVKVPTIGIGAGAGCDGQILVVHDMLGLYDGVRPRFVKQYADLGREVVRAAEGYCREVRAGEFPGPEHGFR